MDNHQAANAFLQLAHIGLLFFGNRAAKRQAHQLLRLFAQLLALDGTQTFNLRFQSGFFFFQFSVFIGGFHQRQLGLLVADGVETIAQTLDFILFDFFHGDLIC